MDDVTAPDRRPATRLHGGDRGGTVVESLVAITVLGLVAAALTGLLSSSTGVLRAAALEGRRAELAQRVGDLVRAGLVGGSSGTIHARIGGEDYEAKYALRDDVAPGAIEVTAASPGGGTMTLAAARVVPAAPEP